MLDVPHLRPSASEKQSGLLGFYHRMALNLRIVVALRIGAAAGHLTEPQPALFKRFSDIVL